MNLLIKLLIFIYLHNGNQEVINFEYSIPDFDLFRFCANLSDKEKDLIEEVKYNSIYWYCNYGDDYYSVYIYLDDNGIVNNCDGFSVKINDEIIKGDYFVGMHISEVLDFMILYNVNESLVSKVRKCISNYKE